jgi:thiamine-phosphate pyrophosphorylase
MSSVFPPLYAILDADLLKTSEISFAEMMAECGVELLQYRAKHASSRQVYETSQQLSARLADFGRGRHGESGRALRFIVNDRPDIAMLVGAGGVHVGQNDLGVEQARAIVGGGRWVGVSTHDLEQLAAADKTSANYVAFGPVFATNTKERHDPVVGLQLLAQARALTSKPLVAIGGITLEHAAAAYGAGADSLAVARDLILARDPQEQARAFLREAARVRKSSQAGA